MPRITKMPASISRYTSAPIDAPVKRKVAAYARVSTDNEEQLTSYAAQISYYTDYIKGREDWEFVKVYTDEGISGCSTKRREGFQAMVADALAGKIDLIITKSVSRFARNTVDSLTTIRSLKEHNVECYFEKENIWTFDGKGELLLTIMSSISQEEARSISENVTWGQRKRMADGKVSLAYSRFLGYDRGADGKMVINPEQAETVRLIYRWFLEGMTPHTIAVRLTEKGIKTPGGKDKWSATTIRRILTNEKYNLDTPECVKETIVAKPTKIQCDIVEKLAERADRIQNGAVDSSVDNMLCVTNDGRKCGLDQRLINPMLPDEPGTKVNLCVENVFNIWNDTKENRLTQLIFCDMGVPNIKADKAKSDPDEAEKANDEAIEEVGKISIYDDIREKLVEKGVPREEVAFIHEAKNEAAKAEMFAKVRNGDIRVLIGSTAKMGCGTNVQTKLVALHDLDAPWRPADMEQRRGRMVRQGNENEKVNLFRYVTEKTFDSYLFQTLENKQKFIGQIMTSKSPARNCADVDAAALSYSEVKALCAGNPLIKEKMTLENEIAELKMIKSSYDNQHYQLQDNVLKKYPVELEKVTRNMSWVKDT